MSDLKYSVVAVKQFENNNLRRIAFPVHVSKSDNVNMYPLTFKMDTGSDFTVVSFDELIHNCRYSKSFLLNCPFHPTEASAVTEGQGVVLQYIENVTLLIDCIELRHQKIFFSSKYKTRNLLGSDILKYFDKNIHRITGTDKSHGYIEFYIRSDIEERIQLGLETDISFLE